VPAFVGGLATLAGFVVVWCRGPARADSALTDRLVRWWASVWLHAGGARVTVEGLENVSAGTSYVVVSNHESNLDPILRLSVLPMSLAGPDRCGAVPDHCVRPCDADDRDDRGGPGEP
jgi:1-acyl-sn-glycerol-3-phosphate acyltransferase